MNSIRRYKESMRYKDFGKTGEKVSVLGDGIMPNLERFKKAQANGVYVNALEEIRRGRKRSHWMWFIFPQIDGLGFSPMTSIYAIKDQSEAREYLMDEMLGSRLREICQALLELPENDPHKVFGSPDDLKLRSSMTLFDYVAPNEIFAEVLEKYYAGERDKLTLDNFNSISS